MYTVSHFRIFIFDNLIIKQTLVQRNILNCNALLEFFLKNKYLYEITGTSFLRVALNLNK